MKLIKTLTYVMILSLSFASYAEAKGKSFSGGFRSQRTAPAPRPVTQAAVPAGTSQSKSLFGSFGSKSGAPTTAVKNAQPLNMSKDMNTNAAQGNALKTADGRTDQAAGSGSGWFRSGNTAKPAQPSAAIPAGAQSAPARQGGGFMNNAMWFMLGSSLASHGRAAPAPTAEQTAGQAGQVQAPGSEVAATDPAIIAPPAAEKESFFMGVLRLVLWGGIFYGIYRIAKAMMRSKTHSAAKKPNYTFGHN